MIKAVSCGSGGGNALMIREVRSEEPDWFELTGMSLKLLLFTIVVSRNASPHLGNDVAR